MPFSTLQLDCTASGVATLTLARPQKHNALSAEMIAELTQAVQTLAQDDTLRCVVLSAQGKSFCAGSAQPSHPPTVQNPIQRWSDTRHAL